MEQAIAVYVEREKFLRDMMEKAMLSAGIRLYTYEDRDCQHFIDDLQPNALILDATTVDEAFVRLYYTQIPVILLGRPDELEKINLPVRARMEKPIAPFELISELSRVLSL